ncbi:YceD family protein [Leeia sp. TBRC 13508]|uniref:Large ribosomal RNA subunit accumulation protein YceD n=1 Tax=Leeia speluncae TaxID=2884804 RepID=A0ABS8D8A3_9NEIS|nr:YceD family protein [Leeia speluncae]MCB6184367.1 YceD family protein [Leeia speluncae]
MSEQFIIHNLRFAESGEVLEVKLPQSSFVRLSEEVVRPAGDVHFRLIGGRNSLGLPVLELTVKTTVELICQRCMHSMDFSVDASTTFVVVKYPDQVEVFDTDEEDAIMIDDAFNVLEYVEDEILLALPSSPRHEKCVDSSAAAVATETNKKPNPFAVLAELKNR